MNDKIELLKKELKTAKLVCVSKYHSIEEIKRVQSYGIVDFGESRANELLEKAKEIKNVNWHFIGRLQTNKVKYIIDLVCLIHSVASLKLVCEIDKQAKKHGKIMDILVQINISQEISKQGLMVSEVEDFIKACFNYENVQVKGIMVIGPNTDDKQKIAKVFARAQEVFEHLQKKYPSIKILSMGMSNDYQIALSYGSNMVRIGSYIFND